ncbi:MAG: hypothetical protein ACK5L6_00165 [Anaerorhabdus sp.]|uniref:hypothetical protein n=1 Tax=Anaerorhabdus sp. TaxID=1872524 RepID=UPI003A86D3ED
MQSKEKKLGPILKNILSSITLLAVVSTIAMPVYAENTIHVEATEETTQGNVESEVVAKEVIIEETQGGIVENTIVEEAPVTMNFALSNQVVVSFELDNAADGQYVGESTRIELDANTKIDLGKVPDFTPSGAKEFTGWTLNGQPLTGYANPFMYLMNNMTITENLVFKPVFGSATKYRIQLGIKELNTGWLTGQVTFYYSTDIPFNTVFTKENFNQVQAQNGYYFRGWELNGVLYTTYEELSAEASKIQNSGIELRAVFTKLEFTVEFAVADDSKGFVTFENGTEYIQYFSDKKEVNGYSIIGQLPTLHIAEGYEFDSWIFGRVDPISFTQEEIEYYFTADDFRCNQYFAVKVKKTDAVSTPTPTPGSTPVPTPEVATKEEVVVNIPIIKNQENNTVEAMEAEEIPLVDYKEVTETINTEETPLVLNNKGSWALFNLLFMGFAIILAIFFLFKKNKENEEEKTEVYYKKWAKVTMVFIAVLSVIIFVLTENMSLPMVMVDKYTVVMFVIAVAQIIMIVIGKKKIEIEEKETLSIEV